MAWYTSILGWAANALIYMGYTLGVTVLILALSYPLLKKKLFPIVFVVLKNAGGARDNSQVMLTRKVTMRGRTMKTDYGPRIKILGIKGTLPMTVVSSENAIPWEAGGRAYAIYEKEVGQFYAVDPHLQHIEIKTGRGKEEAALLKRVHAQIIEKFPQLTDRIILREPSWLQRMSGAVIRPVLFANDHVKLQPVPTDMITQQTYNARIRRDILTRQNWWDKYGQYVMTALMIGALIVTLVLSYEQVNKIAAYRVGAAAQQEKSPGEKVADFMGGETAPGGGMFIPFLPFMLGRRWKKCIGEV